MSANFWHTSNINLNNDTKSVHSKRTKSRVSFAFFNNDKDAEDEEKEKKLEIKSKNHLRSSKSFYSIKSYDLSMAYGSRMSERPTSILTKKSFNNDSTPDINDFYNSDYKNNYSGSVKSVRYFD
jgi:hypothetical protein